MKKIIFSQYGRSMVEMLGVLAIIGVLSVGSISGYSKAMMKYKMNKFATSMNELLNTCLQYTGRINSATNSDDGRGAQYLANILYKLNALPDSIKYNSTTDLIDMFGNHLWPYVYPDSNFSGIGYDLSLNGKNELSSEICHQLVNIAKENSSQLTNISIDTAKRGEEFTLIGRYYGDYHCSKDKECIKNMTLSDISTACHSCVDGNCRFYFGWN